MKKLYEKPNAEWVEFELEKIMSESGGIGGDYSIGGDDGVGDDEGWD